MFHVGKTKPETWQNATSVLVFRSRDIFWNSLFTFSTQFDSIKNKKLSKGESIINSKIYASR